MAQYYVGEIRMFAGRNIPQNWHLCDGSTIPIAGNELLYATIGITYGGDGQTNFKLPDLRGRVPLSFGTAATGTPYNLGAMAGAETVTLQPPNVPAHTHIAYAMETATQTSPENAVWADNAGAGFFSTSPPNAQMAGDALGPSGTASPTPINNVMPSFPINFIIAMNGLYPQRP